MREPSVTTATWHAAADQFSMRMPMQPRSSGVSVKPRERVYCTENCWHTWPTVGV